MNLVGLHIKNFDCFEAALKSAKLSNLNIFQTFFINKVGNNKIEFDASFRNNFLKNYKPKFDKIFIHAPYIINLTYGYYSTQPVLKHELRRMRDLELRDIIFHCGGLCDNSVEKSANNVSKLLNYISKNNPNLIFYLENTAFGKNSFASNIEDLNLVYRNLDYPEKVKICIDTAHAYSFGYEINDNFIELLKTLPENSIKLIHLNDSGSLLGEKIDTHAPIGSGNIGIDNLKRFIQNEFLKDVPVILELPDVEHDQEILQLDMVKSWINY